MTILRKAIPDCSLSDGKNEKRNAPDRRRRGVDERSGAKGVTLKCIGNKYNNLSEQAHVFFIFFEGWPDLVSGSGLFL